MNIDFSKMHGLGNDFIVIDGIRQVLPPSLTTPASIAHIADRRLGVGCDQVLILEADDEADFLYRVFNADGGEVGQCGNGARCAHAFLHHRGLTRQSKLSLKTLTTRLQTEQLSESTVRVYLPPAQFEENFTFEGRVFHRLNIGNPHAVRLSEHPDRETVAHIGARLNEEIGGGINVGFGRVENEEIALSVYERGVGMTAACGSGAVAAALVAFREGLLASPARVRMDGGELLCGLLEDGSSWLEGEIKHVYDGKLCDQKFL